MKNTPDFTLPDILRQSGVSSWSIVPLFIPKKYFDLHQAIDDFQLLVPEQESLLVGRFSSKSMSFNIRAPKLDVVLHDTQCQPITVSLFGDTQALQEKLNPGVNVYATGLVKQFRGQLYLNKAQLLISETALILPIYSIPKRLAHDPVEFAIKMKDYVNHNQFNAVQYLLDLLKLNHIQDERALLQQIGCQQSSLTKLILSTHKPESVEQGMNGIQSFIHLASHVFLQSLSTPPTKNRNSALTRLDRKLIPQLLKTVPFTLTSEQRQAIDDIFFDLRSQNVMFRLLNGETGSGKSIVICVIAALTYIAGYRVAIMSPSLATANQIYNEFKSFWPDLNIQLITGSSQEYAQSGAQCLFGTTALLHRVSGQVDLSITDEQHLYSQDQREKIARHNLLEVSATPLPKTLAKLQFGSMQVSYLKKCFVKKDIRMQLFYPEDKERIVKRVQYIVETGGKACIVYPLAKTESEEKANLAADRVHKKWEKYFPGRVAHVHGKKSDEDKLQAIQKMVDGHSDLLIATTVISVGVTIPGLNYICIAGCENMGQVTIWQLRGRLVRKAESVGFCDLLLLKPVKQETIERLEFICTANSGEEIALQDMKRRGIGGLTKKQSGAMEDLLPGRKLSVEHLENYLKLQD